MIKTKNTEQRTKLRSVFLLRVRNRPLQQKSSDSSVVVEIKSVELDEPEDFMRDFFKENLKEN